MVMVACAAVAWQVHRRVDASGYTRIETDRSVLVAGIEGVDPRWQESVRREVARLEDAACDDREALQRIADALAALPFVAEVDEAVPFWPDGVQIPVRLRVPIACVRVGRHFLPVAADGVVLPGRWSGPVPRSAGFLPVLGPLDGSLDGLRPGALLFEEHLLDALSVASSLLERLDPPSLELLGRVVIDCRAARRASPEEPGAILLLEGGREVLFGRSPRAGEPGELPVALKCSSLARGLAQLGDGIDWELLDVRWDRPEIRLREEGPGGW